MAAITLTLNKSDESNQQTTIINNNTTINNTTNKYTSTQAATNSTEKVVIAGAGYTLAKQGFNLVSSNVGKYTGNTHLQSEINNATTAVSLGILTITNPTAGVTAIATTTINSVVNENYRTKIETLTLSSQRTQAGYSSQADILASGRH